MAVLNLDFSVAQDDLVPEGEYPAVIDRVEAKASARGDGINLNWTFVLADEVYKGRKVFLTTGTGEKAIWKLKETLQALGVYQEGMPIVTDDLSNVIVQPRLAGLPALVKVQHREWEGRTRMGVESVRPSNGGNGVSPNGGQQFR